MNNEAVHTIEHPGIDLFARMAILHPPFPPIQKVEVKLVCPREGLHGVVWYALQPSSDHPLTNEYNPVALLLDPKYFSAPHVYALCKRLEDPVEGYLVQWIKNFLDNDFEYLFSSDSRIIQIVKVTEIPLLLTL